MAAGLTGRLLRAGIRRGVVEGSRIWLAVALGTGVLKVAHRLWARRPVSEGFRLDPGQTLEIRHLPADRG